MVFLRSYLSSVHTCSVFLGVICGQSCTSDSFIKSSPSCVHELRQSGPKMWVLQSPVFPSHLKTNDKEDLLIPVTAPKEKWSDSGEEFMMENVQYL